MKALKWLLIVLGGLAAIAVAVGLVLPDTRHVERSIVVNARPSTVFMVLNGFRQFEKWSPWAKLDPNATVTYDGPVMGVGAKHAWRGDERVGAGSQEIIDSVPYERVRIRLVFEGFDSENTATYTLAPQGEGTQVTWSYDTVFGGNLVGRYFGMFLDKMIGGDYEKGLAQLKTLVESLPQEDFSDLSADLVESTPAPLLMMDGEGPLAKTGALLAERYAAIKAYAESAGAKQVEAPIAITREFNEETGYWKFQAAIPVDRADLAPPEGSGIVAGTRYAGLALRALHRGPYAAMAPTYRKLVALKAAAGFEDNGNSWEDYVTDPASTPEAQLETHIYWPVK